MYIIIPLIVGFVVYSLKLIVDVILNNMHKKINGIVPFLFRSGGFPSIHSAFVSSAVVLIGLTEGFDSSLFVAFLIIAVLFCYDAIGVRRQVGQQGIFLNKMPKDQKNNSTVYFNERVGHNFWEMLGGVLLGGLLTLFSYYLLFGEYSFSSF